MKDGILKWHESRKLLVLLLHPNLRVGFRHTSGAQGVIKGTAFDERSKSFSSLQCISPCLCRGQLLLPQRAEMALMGFSGELLRDNATYPSGKRAKRPSTVSHFL